MSSVPHGISRPDPYRDALRSLQSAVRGAVNAGVERHAILAQVARDVRGTSRTGPVEQAAGIAMDSALIKISLLGDERVTAGARVAAIEDRPLTIDLLAQLRNQVDGRQTLAAALTEVSQ